MTVVGRSGHRLVRVAFEGRADAAAVPETFHAQLVSTGALVEFHGVDFAAVDVDSDELGAVLDAIEPFRVDGRIEWEWGCEWPHRSA